MIDLNDEEFKKVVNGDIREQVRPEQAQTLRQPENLLRWYHALLEMKVSTESQLSHDRADRSAAYAKYVKGETAEADYVAYLAERDMWRANVLHFKTGIERKIAEAKRLRIKHASDERVNKFRTAIERHRMAIGGTDDYTSADEELWSVLSE